jgi:hypothetical protein
MPKFEHNGRLTGDLDRTPFSSSVRLGGDAGKAPL